MEFTVEMKRKMKTQCNLRLNRLDPFVLGLSSTKQPCNIKPMLHLQSKITHAVIVILQKNDLRML